MRDPLKKFVDQHRPEMDTAEPSSQLWNKIETQMNFAPAIASHTFPWLKSFFFGASVVAVAAASFLLRPGKQMPPTENYTPVPVVLQTDDTTAVTNLPVKKTTTDFHSPMPATNTAFLLPENSTAYFSPTDSVSKHEPNTV